MANQSGTCPKCKEAIEPAAKRCKHCQADLRNWFIRHKVITGILGLLLLGIIASAGSNDSSSSTQSATNTATTSNAVVQEEQATEPEKPKEWTSVAKLTATEAKQSETFSLQGGQQKLLYETTGGDYSVCSVYIMKDGTTLDENGGFPEVMIDGTKKDETLLRKSGGDYYFDISTANGSCTVELQELQ